ncbi:MAG: hypothetical protein Q9195_008719 [Heterodermia aff. obscurata]
MTKDRFPELYVRMEDESPSLRHRTVPLEVLVLGYARTGTSSIQIALEQLGFGPCYHMRVAMNQYPRDCAMWMKALEAKFDGKGKLFERKEWDQLLGRHRSVCDMPAVSFATDLMLAYPEAKIILTNRDPDSWHASMSRTVLQSNLYWLHNVLQHLDWATGLVHPMRRKAWHCMFGDNFETKGKEAMIKHYKEVRACAEAQGREVLELQLGDGWHRLCKFLDVPVPDHAYPRENDGNNFIPKMKERARLRMQAVALRWLKVVSIAAILTFATGLLIRSFSGRKEALAFWSGDLRREYSR